jgi:YggT family protein
MVATIFTIVNFIISAITLLIVLKVLLSYFVAPYQPVRLFIDRIVDPMLRPIQRLIPSVGGLDISPLILIIIVWLIGRIINSILAMIFH